MWISHYLSQILVGQEVWVQLSSVLLGTCMAMITLRGVYNMLRRFAYEHNWSLLYLLTGNLYRFSVQVIWLTMVKVLYDLLATRYPALPGPYYAMVAHQVLILYAGIWALLRFLNKIREHFLLGQASQGFLELQLATVMLRLLYGLLAMVFGLGSLYILDTPIPFSPIFSAIVKCILVWTCGIIVLYLLYVLLNQYGEDMARRGHYKRYVFLKGLYMPLMWTVMTLVYIFSVATLRVQYLALGIHYTEVLVFCFFWTFYRGTVLLEEQLLLGHLTERYPDKGLVQTTGKFSRIVIVIMMTLVFFSLRGYEIATISTFLGGSALGVGFAAREIIANYLSGAIMYFEGKFKVGEWIYSVDQQVEGTIEYIGLRTTDIRTFEKRLLTVPNSFFSSTSIINASRMTHRRIKETIPIERTEPATVEKIIQEVRVLLQNHPGIDPTQALMVHFTSFGASALNVNLYAFTKTRDWKTYRNVQQDIFLKTIKIVKHHGGALAFPTRKLQLSGDKPGALGTHGAYQSPHSIPSSPRL